MNYFFVFVQVATSAYISSLTAKCISMVTDLIQNQSASVSLVLLVNGRSPTDSSDASNAIAFINCTQNPNYHQCCYQILCISTSWMLIGFPIQSFTYYYLYINFSRTLYLPHIYTHMHMISTEASFSTWAGLWHYLYSSFTCGQFWSVFGIPFAFESASDTFQPSN